MKPENGDGFVNWLTTHLINALGHAPVTRARARIAVHQGEDICRVDVAASNTVWAKASRADHVSLQSASTTRLGPCQTTKSVPISLSAGPLRGRRP